MKKGFSQVDAHSVALKELNHHPFQIYNPDVVISVDKLLGIRTMNSGFYKYWGL